MNIINTTEPNQVNDNSLFCAAITTKNKRCSFKSKCNGLCSRHNKKGLNNIKTIFNTSGKLCAYNSNVKLKRVCPIDNKYDKNDIMSIIKIQSYIRKKIVDINIKDRGISAYCRNLLTNDTDFAEFLDIKDSSLITNYNFISNKNILSNCY